MGRRRSIVRDEEGYLITVSIFSKVASAHPPGFSIAIPTHGNEHARRFAAGDVVTAPQRCASAVGEGAMAVPLSTAILQAPSPAPRLIGTLLHLGGSPRFRQGRGAPRALRKASPLGAPHVSASETWASSDPDL